MSDQEEEFLVAGAVSGIAPSYSDGEIARFSLTQKGELRVHFANHDIADKALFTYGTSTEDTIGGVYQDTSPTLTPGQRGAVRLTQSRGFHTNLRDSLGNEIKSLLDVAGDRNLAVTMTHNIFVSLNNSSTANLNSGATFTGVADNNLNATTVQINFKADQPCTIVVEQSNDGANWDFEDSFYYDVDGGETRIFVAAGSFVRVKVTNNGTSATTYFNLQTILVPIQGVWPRALSERGNFKTTINEIGHDVDSLITADKSIDGASINSTRVKKLSGNFSLPISNNDVSTSSTGTGTVTSASSMAIIATGTGVTSSAKLNTNQSNTYSVSKEAYAFCAVKFTTPTNVNSEQRVGPYSATDGLWIGSKGLSFGITTRQNSVDTFVDRTAFSEDLLNGNPNSRFTKDDVPVAIDFTKLNRFRIRYGFAISTILFQTLCPDGHWVTFHKIKNANTATVPNLFNPNVPFTIEAIKSSSDATDLKISIVEFEAGTTENPSAYGIEEQNGRKFVTTNVVNQTTSQTVYTVSTGRILKVSTLLISVSNSSLVTNGQLNVRDGNGGTIIVPLTTPASTNQASAGNNIQISFPIPIRFSSAVYAQIASGNLTYSLTFVGYEVEA